MPKRIENLGDWPPEPYIKMPVMAALEGAGRPVLLREIVAATGISYKSCDRVLKRLCEQGLAERRKLPMSSHAFCRRSWQIIPGKAQRLMFVYKWVRSHHSVDETNMMYGNPNVSAP